MVQIFEIRTVCKSPLFVNRTDIIIVLATQAIANVVKSSFGPSGLDKMMVDDIGVGFEQVFCGRSTLSDPRTSQ